MFHIKAGEVQNRDRHFQPWNNASHTYTHVVFGDLLHICLLIIWFGGFSTRLM